MATKQTNDALRRLFRSLNKVRFNNAIEEPDIIRFADLNEEEISGHATTESQGSTVIEIDQGLRTFPSLTEIVMLHEQAHLKVGTDYEPSHGMRFQAEIWRLIQEGAYDRLL